jgi:hypothetical protein
MWIDVDNSGIAISNDTHFNAWYEGHLPIFGHNICHYNKGQLNMSRTRPAYPTAPMVMPGMQVNHPSTNRT